MLIRPRRTALSKMPHALADGLILVFQHPVEAVSLSGDSSGFGVWSLLLLTSLAWISEF
jgi:hypothetical protein